MHRRRVSFNPFLIIGLAVLIIGLLLLRATRCGLTGPAITYYKTSEAARDVIVVGNYAYVVTAERRLRLIDVSNPAAPAEVGVYDTPESLTGVAVANSYAYVAAGDHGLRVVDVSNPAIPLEVGDWDTPGYVEDVAVAGNYAYVAAGDHRLRVVDVSNPTAPVEVGAYDKFWLYTTGALVMGNYVYLNNRNGDMPIVEISNPTAPSEVGFIPGGNARPMVDNYSFTFGELDLAIEGGYAFFIVRGACVDLCLPNFLLVVDSSNPAASAMIGSYRSDTRGSFLNVAAAGNSLYIAAGSDGLRVFDIANPTAPVEVGSCDTSGYAEGVAVAGDYIYIADGDQGLAILRHASNRAIRPTSAAGPPQASTAAITPTTSPYTYYGEPLPTPPPFRVDGVRVPPAWLMVAWRVTFSISSPMRRSRTSLGATISTVKVSVS